MKEQRLEYCFACGEPTGKRKTHQQGGIGYGSVRCACGAGPLCDECWDMHNCPHKDKEDKEDKDNT